MKKELINKISKAKVNPIFDGLDDGLKEPENFQIIERKLARIMISDHKHTTIKQFIKCKRCKVKMQKKTDTIKQLGFKDFVQYQNWKKIMNMIINKQDIKLYDKD